MPKKNSNAKTSSNIGADISADQYIGHDKCWGLFEKALHSGKLHHGWILAGPRAIGKAHFAARMAENILDPQNIYSALLRAGTHPDLHILTRPLKELPKEGEAPEKDAELKRNISVDQIRKLQMVLNVKPSMSDKRVIIIDAADDMERGAANALLKSLEEPPQGTIFILISHSSEKLLPTIKSRCQIMRFDPLNDEMMQSALDIHVPNLSMNEKMALIRAGQGSPGQSLAYMGLDLADIEAALDLIRKQGDADNIIRAKLVKLLSLKAAQAKYEAFLRRVPSYIAQYAQEAKLSDIPHISDAYDKSLSLASRAIGLTLDKPSVVFEMVSLLSTLQTHKPKR